MATKKSAGVVPLTGRTTPREQVPEPGEGGGAQSEEATVRYDEPLDISVVMGSVRREYSVIIDQLTEKVGILSGIVEHYRSQARSKTPQKRAPRR